VLASLRITEAEKERERERDKEFGGLLRLRRTQHAHAHKKAKRSGEAERSEEGGFGGLPRQRYNTTRPRAQQAKRSREGPFLRLQCNTTCHEAEKRATLSSVFRFSYKFSALETLEKPNRGVPRNALLCSFVHMPALRDIREAPNHAAVFKNPTTCDASNLRRIESSRIALLFWGPLGLLNSQRYHTNGAR
jgi:hypothetical protein